MIEILILISATRKLARMAAQRGRSGWYAALGPLFWVVGEVIGAFVGALMGLEMGAYLFALVLAALGLGAAFIVVSQLSPPEGTPEELPDRQEDPSEDLSAHQDPRNPYSPPRKA